MKKLLIISAMMATSIAASAQGQGIGIHLENMNPAVDPGTDFYQYACGGWIANNPLAPEYSRFGSFDMVSENNRKQIRELIEGLAATQHEKGSVAQKIGDLYAMMMDSVKQNKEGVKPILADLKAIEDINDRDALKKHLVATSITSGRLPFGMYLEADMMDSKNNMLQFAQSGLSLGQKDYYLNDDEATVKIREAFKKHVVNFFKLVGYSETVATQKMNNIMELETRLAKAHKSRVELRDPASNYHKMTYDELKKQYQGIDWDELCRVNFMDPALMASAMPGAFLVAAASVASGVMSLGENPVPPVVRIRSASRLSARRISVFLSMSVSSGRTGVSITSNPSPSSNAASAGPLSSVYSPANALSLKVTTAAVKGRFGSAGSASILSPGRTMPPFTTSANTPSLGMMQSPVSLRILQPL